MKMRFVTRALEMRCKGCDKKHSDGFVLYSDGSEWAFHKRCAKIEYPRLKIKGFKDIVSHRESKPSQTILQKNTDEGISLNSPLGDESREKQLTLSLSGGFNG